MGVGDGDKTSESQVGLIKGRSTQLRWLKRVGLLFGAIPFLIAFILLTLLGIQYVSLPSRAQVLSAERLGTIFPQLNVTTAPRLKELDLPATSLIHCALCLRSSALLSCEQNQAMQLAMAIERHEVQTHTSFTIRSLVKGTALWLRYDSGTLWKLYIANLLQAQSVLPVETICSNLFAKPCSQLSNQDAALFVSWAEFGDKSMQLLKEDQRELKSSTRRIEGSCTGAQSPQ